jgi:hypothetical protein
LKKLSERVYYKFFYSQLVASVEYIQNNDTEHMSIDEWSLIVAVVPCFNTQVNRTSRGGIQGLRTLDVGLLSLLKNRECHPTDGPSHYVRTRLQSV